MIGHWGSGTGDIARPRAGRRRTARRRTWTSPSCCPPTRTRWPPGWPTPTKRKAMHDAKGPLLALWARGWELAGLTSDTQLAAYLVRPDQRTFDLADLTIRYLKRELKVDAGPDALDAAADQLALDFGDDDSGTEVAAEAAMVRARAVIDLADALDADVEEHNGTSLLYGVELPLQRTLARMEQTGVAVDIDHAGGAGGRVRLHRQPGRRRGVPDPRQADQPRLAQAAAGGAVRRAEDAEDPADPDGLHHRRRGAAAALRQDRAPVPRPDADPPGRHPAPADRRGSAQVGRRRRPDPHHVRADHRRHRSALQHRPEPAEHPDPHRGGPPDPGGVRGRARATSP